MKANITTLFLIALAGCSHPTAPAYDPTVCAVAMAEGKSTMVQTQFELDALNSFYANALTAYANGQMTDVDIAAIARSYDASWEDAQKRGQAAFDKAVAPCDAALKNRSR